MGSVNRSIPNLYNGVSQQPPTLRLPSQATVQENGLSSVVNGLSKRPPTEHIKKLSSRTSETTFIHMINRDVTERYIVEIINGDLFVFDLAGNSIPVSFPDGKSYLTASIPRDSFSATTVADYTFIVNKTVTVAQDTAVQAGALKGSKQIFTDLPTTGNTVGDVWEISGTSSNNFDNYYVKWDGSGTWRETLKVGLKTNLLSSSMPWRLVNNGNGTFTFSRNTWTPRLVGDDASASFPSFIGKPIADVFFHRNRLGFIAGENVVFSRSGDFFNFFPETVTAVLDTDPVDVAVSHNKVAILRHAISFNTALMLFADEAQFQLTAKDTLTPKTSTINVTTEFAIEAKAKPVSSGTSIYFGVTRGNYSGMKEYQVQPLTYSNDASDVTAHVPKYVPNGLFKLAASNLENIITGLTLNERNATYVYRYYWESADTKVQSSWSKFTLDSEAVILSAECINTVLYLVVKRSDGTYFEKLDLQELTDGNLGFRVLVDQKVSLTGTYNSTTNTTTFTTPYPVDLTFKVILGDSFTGNEATVLSPITASGNTLQVTGDYSGGLVYVGRPYTFKYVFSPVVFKDDAKITVAHYVIKVKNFAIMYDATGYFKVTVQPDGRDTYEYIFSGKTLGDVSSIIGSVGVSSGKAKFPVFGDSAKSVITIINDSPLPSTFQAAEWEGVVSTKSKHL